MQNFTPKNSSIPIALAHLEIKDLVVDKEMGFMPSEIGKVQRIVIDVRVGFDHRMTAIADTREALLASGFNAARVRAEIRAQAAEKANLLETLAGAIADRILRMDGAYTVVVGVTKSYAWADTGTTRMEISRTN